MTDFFLRLFVNVHEYSARRYNHYAVLKLVHFTTRGHLFFNISRFISNVA